jgi:hypothetical protein
MKTNPRLMAGVFMLVVGLGGCTPVQKQYRPLELKQAATIAPYAMMAANSYHRPCVYFPLKSLGWVQVDRAGNETAGPTYARDYSLGYDIYRNDRRREFAFVFRGTDSVLDFMWANLAPFVSPQYVFAHERFNEFLHNRRPPYDAYKLVVVGHSLGGGLALHESLSHENIEAYVFNTSPRIFRGSRRDYGPTKRIAVFQNGEILSMFRDRTSLWYLATKPSGAVYETNYDFGPEVDGKRGLAKQIALHDMFRLAETMRAAGSIENRSLAKAKMARRLDPACEDNTKKKGKKG